MAGLCEEGRWELAIDAIRALDLRAIVAQAADANVVTSLFRYRVVNKPP